MQSLLSVVFIVLFLLQQALLSRTMRLNNDYSKLSRELLKKYTAALLENQILREALLRQSRGQNGKPKKTRDFQIN